MTAAAASTAYPLNPVPPKWHIKPDVKPPRRLAITYLGRPGLLRMVGVGNEDHIITRVIPGTDPLQEFDEDDPTDVITIDHETDELDADDLSEVSMTLADAMTKEETSGPFGQCSHITAKGCRGHRHLGRSRGRNDNRPSEPGSSYRGH